MQTLTRKEEQIMQAVWQIGHPCLISEILKKDVTLKRNTVAPGIITLTKKGYLKVDSIGKSMTRTGRAYAPLIDQHAYNEQKKTDSVCSRQPDNQRRYFELYSVTD